MKNLVVRLMEIVVRPFIQSDFPDVSSIYADGIATGVATFETKIPSWETWNAKYIEACRIVAETKGELCGFAVLSQVSNREVYKGVAEVSVYVSSAYRKQGVGKLLLQQLIKESETHGFWTLQAGVFKENKGSIKLHETCGFRVIGYREKIAQRDGLWYDNVLMERRSKLIE